MRLRYLLNVLKTQFFFIYVNAGGGFHNVLVIGADAISRYVDWTDRGTCILFGDAAGAVLLQVNVYLPDSFFELIY